MVDDSGYNQRLFRTSALRKFIHEARYYWAQRTIEKLGCNVASVVEIGCFDARLLDWLPAQPETYLGIDANWESGLDLAREKYRGDSRVTLIEATDPAQLGAIRDRYTMGVAMETLEHVPEELLQPYLEFLSAHVSGEILITVPVEIGPIFAAKWLYKKLVFSDAEGYTVSEFLFATIGKTARVERNEHKGFNYRNFLAVLEEHFQIVSVEGIPFRWLPCIFSFGVGIVCRTRPCNSATT